MAITYIEKGPGLHLAIRAAGHWLEQINNVWVADNEQAVQLIINSYNDLPDYKAIRIAQVKATGLARIQTVFPAITTLDFLLLIREFWLSIAPAARAPTTNWTRLLNTYTTGETAVARINAAVSKAAVDAVVAGINWPA